MITRLMCLLTGHRWSRFEYPGATASTGYVLRCRRCAREREPDRAHWIAL